MNVPLLPTLHVLDKVTGTERRTITGATTTLAGPDQCAAYQGFLYCANNGSNQVLVFPLSGNGNIAPARIIAGASTGFASCSGVVID